MKWKGRLAAFITACTLLGTVTTLHANPFERARQSMGQRDFATAIDILSDHLKKNADDANALRLLGDVHLAAGHWDKAIDVQKRAVAMRPDDAEFHLALAAAYREKARRGGMITAMKNAKKWKAELETAFKIDPTNVDGRTWLSAYLVNAPGIGGGDKDRGIEVALGTIPLDEVEGRMTAGYAYRRSGRYEEAIAQYKKLIALHPGDGSAWGGVGYTLLAMERNSEAIENFEKWIELEPENPQPLDGLGDCLAAQELSDEAVAAFQRALELDQYFSDSRYKLARIYQKRKKKDEAARHYQTLVDLTPEHINADAARKRLRKLKKKR